MNHHRPFPVVAPPADTLQHGRPCPRCHRPFTLSTQSHHVLSLMADGLTNDQIGFRLGIREHVAAQWVRAVRQALNAVSRTQAVDHACRLGLLLPPLRPALPSRLINPDHLQAMTYTVQGHTQESAAAQLGIGAHLLAYLHAQLYERLGIGHAVKAAGKGARAVFLLHGMGLLAAHHPCRCGVDVRESGGVLGRPCPSCGRRVALSGREHEVLTLIGDGRSNTGIGAHYGTSEHGGATAVAAVRRALGVAGRHQAVDHGCRLGLLTPPTDLTHPDPPVTAHQVRLIEAAIAGQTARQTATALRIKVTAVQGARHRLHIHLGSAGVGNPTAHTIFLFHGLGLLPGHHPCHCRTAPNTGATP
ncbi:LuxR C-terminal-related transcriptional regulator [Kitasatospora sp. NPDC001574]